MPAEPDPMSVANAGEHQDAWPPHQPWTALALFSLLLNLLWELLAGAFYVAHGTGSQASTVIACAQAALGDVGITLASYAVAAAVGTRRWVVRPARKLLSIYLGVGLGMTVVLEYINVYVLHRWAYAAVMPTIGGIGIAPLVQWLVLPLVILWLSRRHLAGVLTGFPVHGDMMKNMKR